MMDGINHLAVISASFFILVLGALWYSPTLFYSVLLEQKTFDIKDIKKRKSGRIYSTTLILAILMCYNLAFFLDDPSTDLLWGMIAGLLTGFWAAGIFTVVAIFEQKSWKYALVNAGFIIIYFTLIGLIIGVWR